CRAMDQAAQLGGCRVLQLVARGGFHTARACHHDTCLAVATRRSEAEGHLIAALGIRLAVERRDLDGLVGPFPGTTSRSSASQLSARDLTRWGRVGVAGGGPLRLPPGGGKG